MELDYEGRIRYFNSERPNLFGDVVLDPEWVAKAETAVANHRRQEPIARAAVLRDIVGNPFRRPTP